MSFEGWRLYIFILVLLSSNGLDCPLRDGGLMYFKLVCLSSNGLECCVYFYNLDIFWGWVECCAYFLSVYVFLGVGWIVAWL